MSVTELTHHRNTPAFRIACMKACRTSLVTRAGKSLNAVLRQVITHVLSNITTHHAEDGSGVGSAIIAGTWAHDLLYHHFPHYLSRHDKDQER